MVNADFARSASPPFTVAGLPRGRDHEDRGDDRGDRAASHGDDHGDERDDDHSDRGRGDDDHGGSGRH